MIHVLTCKTDPLQESLPSLHVYAELQGQRGKESLRTYPYFLMFLGITFVELIISEYVSFILLLYDTIFK